MEQNTLQLQKNTSYFPSFYKKLNPQNNLPQKKQYYNIFCVFYKIF